MDNHVTFTPLNASLFDGGSGSVRKATFGNLANQSDPKNGTVGGKWSFTTLGLNNLTAECLGCDTPPQTAATAVEDVSSTPFALTFTANVVCDVVANITPDGVRDEAAWDAVAGNDGQSFSFMANLSKGSETPATLLVTNDCDNIYFLLSVDRDVEDKVAVLRIDFDSDGDGVAEEGDDVVLLEGHPETLASDVAFDRFLTSACLKGGKQAECGEDDTSVGPPHYLSTDVGWEYDDENQKAVYEIKHPLNSGDVRDELPIDIARGIGDDVGFFVTLRQSPSAKGAQGNTQWPGFRVYVTCTIGVPSADGSSTMSCDLP
jgi:hypothetical protein